MAENEFISGNLSVGGNAAITGTLAAAASTLTGNTAITGTLAVSGNVGFYGLAPAAQASVVSAVTLTAPTVTVFGFTTTAQFFALIAAVNSILAQMKLNGFVATS